MAEHSPSDGAAHEPVVAAGTVVLRRGQVLLVHRPKYDDWSFPKGKQDPGEPDVVTAVRETVEETGVEVRLGCPLPDQTYVQRDGRTKLVHYWRGHVVGDPDVSGYAANEEIDHVTWLPVDRAPRRLSYRRDRETLEHALVHPKPTTPLVLLRHAAASDRARWPHDDRLRPLTEQGRAEVGRIAATLAAYGVTRVVSSSSARCVQTVSPYAEEHVLALTTTEVLTEEHQPNPHDACALLLEEIADAEPTVICTHRPLLPALMGHLGVDLPDLGPGDLVVVHHRNGKVRAAELHECR